MNQPTSSLSHSLKQQPSPTIHHDPFDINYDVLMYDSDWRLWLHGDYYLQSPLFSYHQVSLSNIQTLSPSEVKIYHLRDTIKAVGKEFAIAPELIGAIIWDELERRSMEDDLQGLLSLVQPNLVYQHNWSIGIAQIKPKTAENVYQEVLKEQKSSTEIVQALIDDHECCRICGGYLKYIIELWKPQYSEVELTNYGEEGAKLLATLYSIGERGTRGINSKPQFSARGEKIVEMMPRIKGLIEREFDDNLKGKTLSL
ncbi:MAG: hypothetical protein AB4041_19230 [Microcystaceae cyanobacterium]